ncbi:MULTISPECIES: LysR family transcriptional regulator [Pseudomonas]|uniref:LysR family transcriptional regulator n=1 Tax=Pseudomonas citronellolis TaxID=53408 RepID=A0AAW6P7F1_9PSED|nr:MULTISPECIES: LysR family transcriptional regulator [Pseudomonas]KES23029.1 transcriptional regulator [Pseudomonas sp. AAC]MDF3843495.1 LysR family transcriptional regulator [Pseudomonas citronellolis]WAB91905.1 LysR family transcriptional regulator [Pseudomonas citronellolis]
MTESLPGLREMQLFVAVYETRSFTAAATREFATQSGISQHIKQLEEWLGVQLFDRQKAVEPTAAGTAFYQHCLQVLAANDKALQALGSFEHGLSGEVRFGVTATLATYQLAPAYLRLMEQNPNASIAVIDAPSNMLIDRVRANELDFAIIPSISPLPADLSTTVFAATPAFLVSSITHASGFEHGQAIGLDKLAGLKLLAPDSREHAQWSGSQLDVPAGRGPNYQLDAVLATLDLIRQSEWMAILPGLLFVHDVGGDPAERDFRLNPFSGAGLTLELLLVQPSRATPSPLMLEAIRAIQEVTQEHIQLLSAFQMGTSSVTS